MHIRESYDDGRFVWHLDDPSVTAKELHFGMPEGWEPASTHPDLHAAALMLSLRPFLDRGLEVPRAVSPEFAAVAKQEFDIEITPVDEQVDPRRVDDGRVGLAYSGGVDSTAALLLLPQSTCCVFSEMQKPADRDLPTLYRPEAALHALSEVERAGWQVIKVDTNLQYLGDRVAFPVTDASSVESSGAPIALLADHCGFDAIAFGTVMEVTYGVGFGAFRDHLVNIEHRRWRRLLAAADIEVLLPLAGLSEVAALSVVRGSRLEPFAQSCVRGDAGKPCLNCVKCVRKTLTAAAISGDWPTVEEIERLLLVAQFRTTLRQAPVPLSDVYRYALSRCPYSSELIDLVKLRFGATADAASYLEHAYAPAAEAWPVGKRDDVSSEIEARVGRMSDEHAADFRAGEQMDREGDSTVMAFAEALADHLDALAGQPGRASGLVPAERPYLDVARPDTDALRAALERLTVLDEATTGDRATNRTGRLRRRAKVAAGRVRRSVRRLQQRLSR